MKNGDIMGESSPRSVSVCPLTKRHEQAAISSHVQRRVSVSFRDETTQFPQLLVEVDSQQRFSEPNQPHSTHSRLSTSHTQDVDVNRQNFAWENEYELGLSMSVGMAKRHALSTRTYPHVMCSAWVLRNPLLGGVMFFLDQISGDVQNIAMEHHHHSIQYNSQVIHPKLAIFHRFVRCPEDIIVPMGFSQVCSICPFVFQDGMITLVPVVTVGSS